MADHGEQTRVVIMGAAGRDFHNFNMTYRDDPDTRVVAFTATQIPAIAGRQYPAVLAGSNYPQGIPIVAESDLLTLCQEHNVDQVVFAYSDVSHAEVMHKASVVLAGGMDFVLLGPKRTLLQAPIPVIATSAVRTGCGKSQVTRWLAALLKRHKLKVAVIRHPMPYGDLARQAIQRFATAEDLIIAECTVEEREEYEPHLAQGNIVYAGVDYSRIVERAATEADVIVWDGGNNDFPFVRPDLHIVLADPLRSGHETSHHPGEAVLRMADIIVIVKVNSAADANVQQVYETVQHINPTATIVRGDSPVVLSDPDGVHKRRVLVVEDGPTITHGGMAYGAGYVAASRAQAAVIIDPRNDASPEITTIYQQYPHIGAVLPAVGYHPQQLQALANTINNADADVIVSATPCDLSALIELNKPVVRASYEFSELGEPKLSALVKNFIKAQRLGID